MSSWLLLVVFPSYPIRQLYSSSVYRLSDLGLEHHIDTCWALAGSILVVGNSRYRLSYLPNVLPNQFVGYLQIDRAQNAQNM
jgi:hypothetical protein